MQILDKLLNQSLKQSFFYGNFYFVFFELQNIDISTKSKTRDRSDCVS